MEPNLDDMEEIRKAAESGPDDVVRLEEHPSGTRGTAHHQSGKTSEYEVPVKEGAYCDICEMRGYDTIFREGGKPELDRLKSLGWRTLQDRAGLIKLCEKCSSS